MKPVRQSGFTLLEAVVAMTLLVVGGGMLLVWLNTGFKSMERIEATAARIEATRVAMAYLGRVNPMQEPKGSIRLGLYQLTWSSTALTAPKPVVGRDSGSPGIYDAALFRIDASIGMEGELALPLRMEVAGYALVPRRLGDD